MRFRARKTFKLGPFRATVNQAGKVSWSIKAGPLTYSLSRRTTSIDTPGPGHVVFGGKRRKGGR